MSDLFFQTKKEVIRFCNEAIKTHTKSSADERRQGYVEKKLEELADKIDDLAKQVSLSLV